MRSSILALGAVALALTACGPSHPSQPIYTQDQLQKMLAQFEPYCLSPENVDDMGYTRDMRDCGPSTVLVVYQLTNGGNSYVGELSALDRATGALRVVWSQGSDEEWFAPGSSHTLAGKVTEIATTDNPDWLKLYDQYQTQHGPISMSTGN